MKKFIELIQKMYKINSEEKERKIIEISEDINVPDHIQVIYQKMFDYFYEIFIKDAEKRKALFSYVDDCSEEEGENNLDNEKVGEKIEECIRKLLRIAGGCISDLLITKKTGYEKKEKDVDIFISEQLIVIAEDEVVLGKSNAIKFIKKVFEDCQVDKTFDFGRYDRKSNIITLKLTIDAVNVDLIVKKSYFDLDRLVLEFDFFFRAFSYDGKKIYGTKKALESIEQRKLELQDISSPFSTFIRSYIFADRYGFTIDEYDRRILITAMSLNKEYNLINTYTKTRDKKSIEEERSFINKAENKNLTHYSLKKFFNQPLETILGASKRDIFVQILLYCLQNIEKYGDKYQEKIKNDLYSYFDENQGKNRLINFYLYEFILQSSYNFSGYKSRLIFFLKNKMYIYINKVLEIDQFEFDEENFYTSKNLRKNQATKKELFEKMDSFCELLDIQNQFSDNQNIFFNEQKFFKEFDSDFVSFNLTSALYAQYSLINWKKSEESIKDFYKRWNRHLDISLFDLLALSENKLFWKVKMFEDSFRSNDIWIECAYDDLFKQYNSIEKNFINIFDENCTGNDSLDFYISFNLVLHFEKNNCSLGCLNHYNFLYFNGKRYDRLVKFLEETFEIKINRPEIRKQNTA